MKKLISEFLCQWGLTDTDQELVRLYGLHGTANADEAAAWFASVDFEQLRPECTCMAAVMGAENAYGDVPIRLQPRLKGLLRYHRMLNSGLYAAMCGMVRVYNRHGIDVLAMKGAAIKTGYRPDFVRPMWDVDILVRPEDYDRALKIAYEEGYKGSWAPHSVDLKRSSTEAIDLHAVYMKDLLGRQGRSYWPECREICWNEARFFVPQRHALLLQLMVNAHNNFTRHDGRCMPLRWIMDIDALLPDAEESDWDKLIELAKQLKVEAQTSIMLAAYDFLLPGRIDAAAILSRLNAIPAAKRMIRFMARYRKIDRVFRHPPENCSTLKLALIHIRWLWMDCRAGNPGSWFHGLRCFPEYLRGELQVKSLLQLPAVAIRKIRSHRGAQS